MKNPSDRRGFFKISGWQVGCAKNARITNKNQRLKEVLQSKVKAIIVRMVLFGLINEKVAFWMINRGGLRNA